jgi:hypothetical protein
MPPSAALAVPLTSTDPVGIHIRPLLEHRRSPRPCLAVIDGAGPDQATPPPIRGPEVRRLLTGVLEVLDGRRPVGQLAAVLPRKHQKSLLTEAGTTGPGPRTLRSMHLSRTTPEIVDLCARIDHAGRSRAITGRLEFHHERWRFTLLAMV